MSGRITKDRIGEARVAVHQAKHAVEIAEQDAASCPCEQHDAALATAKERLAAARAEWDRVDGQALVVAGFGAAAETGAVFAKAPSLVRSPPPNPVPAGWFGQMDPDVYHADPCVMPSLSQGIAHTLIAQSPAHARLAHPRLGNRRGDVKRAMDVGTVVHKLLLGAGRDIVRIDADDWRTKDARAKRDAFRALGKTPVLGHELERAEAIAAEVRPQLDALDIRLTGENEMAAFWMQDNPLGSNDVVCRGMLDHWIESQARIIDIKTTANAHPDFCTRQIYAMGYDIQDAAYRCAIEALRPELAGRVSFLFVFIEATEPFCVTPIELRGSMREVGRSRWNYAVGVWDQCLRTNRWPGYVEKAIGVEAHPWMVAKSLDSQVQRGAAAEEFGGL